MKHYLQISDQGKTETTNIRIAEPDEFFESINRWFIEDDTTTSLRVDIDLANYMILLDTKFGSEEKLVFGRDGMATLFESKEEIESVLSTYVDQHEEVTLNLPDVVH